MKNILIGIASVVSPVLAAIAVVLMAAWFLQKIQGDIGVEFRAACSQANGKTVWNGRHWECLK